MLDSYRLWPHIRARIESGPLASYVDAYVTQLEEEGYARSVVRCHICGLDAFGTWLSKRRIRAEGIDAVTVERFARGFQRCVRGEFPEKVSGVRKFAEFLWGHGVAERISTPASVTEIEIFLRSFDEHLRTLRGLSPGTCRNYLRYARAFTETRFPSAALEWGKIGVNDVTEFVRAQAAKLKPTASQAPVTATCALLRYLASTGEVPSGFYRAVPTVRQWKHAALPAFLPTDEIERVLAHCDDTTPVRRRDRAILFLLARLGPRASEVAGLRLDDIDWREGHVTIHASKSGRERRLPLPADVGSVLVSYLREGRPKRPDSTIFLQAQAPYGPLSGGAVTSVAQRALKRAGVSALRPGAHVFRHSAATQMVRRGVTFKAVADVLGHTSIETTAIYAKLDVDALARVSLPWPGGVR